MCEYHKEEHAKSRPNHNFGRLKSKIVSDELFKIIEDLTQKIKKTDVCEVRIIQETKPLIEKIQTMLRDTLEIINRKRKTYIMLLEMSQQALLPEQINEISVELKKSLEINVPKPEVNEIEEFFGLDFLEESIIGEPTEAKVRLTKDVQIKNLNEKCKHIESQLQEIQIAYSKKSFEIEELNNQLAAITKEKQDINDQLKKATHENENLTKKYYEDRSQSERMAQELEQSAKREKEELLLGYNAACEQKELLSKSISELKLKLEILEPELISSQNHISQQNEKISSLQEEISSYDKELQAHKQELLDEIQFGTAWDPKNIESIKELKLEDISLENFKSTIKEIVHFKEALPNKKSNNAPVVAIPEPVQKKPKSPPNEIPAPELKNPVSSSLVSMTLEEKIQKARGIGVRSGILDKYTKEIHFTSDGNYVFICNLYVDCKFYQGI